MARFRKIDVRMWSDSKFRELSPIPPCGQGLWIYLLTSPYTTNIPGLYRASEGALADDLRWPLKAFRKAFLEASTNDMVQADWSAPLVFVKNALRYNRPESPNVITSWRSTWDEIPECSLKVSAYQHLKAFAEDLPKAFLEAFTKALPEGSLGVRVRAQGDPLANQEQEQEQEQEQDLPLTPSRGNGLDGFDEFWNQYPKSTRNSKFESRSVWKKLHPSPRLVEQIMGSLAAWKRSHDWLKDGGKFIPGAQKFLRKHRWEEIPDPGRTGPDELEGL